MKQISDFIHSKFSVAGTYSNKILLFDVDDTLLHSDIKVYVKKDGKDIKSLSSAEYNHYRLKPGESFDYREFCDEEVLNNRFVFLKYWDTLKREYAKGTHIGILSARKNHDMFHRFFIKHGIDIKNELIFTISDDSLDIKGDTIEDRKAYVIGKLSKWGYKTIVFFDDNEVNLKTAKKLENKFDIKVITVKA